MTFGVMYLHGQDFQSLQDFRRAAFEKRFEYYEDVFDSTYRLLDQNRADWAEVKIYRIPLETYVLSWCHLLFESQSQWRELFAQWHTNATWQPKRILNASEVMRLGWGPHMLPRFNAQPWPPPSADVSNEVMQLYWSHIIE